MITPDMISKERNRVFFYSILYIISTVYYMYKYVIHLDTCAVCPGVGDGSDGCRTPNSWSDEDLKMIL